MNKDSVGYIVSLVVALCLVFSAVVSIAAIGLRERQQQNIVLERNANLLVVAGLLEMNEPNANDKVAELLEGVETRVVDLRTGLFAEDINPAEYDQLTVLGDAAWSAKLVDSEDLAGIGFREHYGEIYVVRSAAGGVDALVFPVRGYGLWSTMYGFVALEGDLSTVRGFGFYQQGETPGLGGEVDNPKWKKLWPGKQMFGESGELKLAVVKNPNPDNQAYVHQIDAISGASLTSRGVDNLIKFWMGELGYGQFLSKLRDKEITL